MKKVVQVVLCFIGVCILFGIFIAACSGGNNQPGGGHMQEKPKSEQQQAEPPKQPESKETTTPVDEGLDQAKYDQIIQGDALSGEGGSTVTEVVNLLGEPNSQTETQTDVLGQKMTMKVYTWMDSDLKTIIISFNNDHVTNKSFTK